jgi:hypothetical protein
MIRVHRVLAFVLAALVLVQAAAIVWAFDGEGRFVDQGGVVTKALIDDRTGPRPFTEVIGFMVHGMNGEIVIPVVALALLVVSFFTKVRGAVRWSATILVLIVVQILLGLGQGSLPFLGLLHGPNALLIFGAAVMTAVRSNASNAVGAPTTREPARAVQV